MLDIICTRKEKTLVILFFEIYKMMLIIFKSENCSYTGDPPLPKIVVKLIHCKPSLTFGSAVNSSNSTHRVALIEQADCFDKLAK